MSYGFDTGVKGLIILSAGGTGGHLFPAQALAEELVRRGYVIHLLTDDRVEDHGNRFPAEQVHIIRSATLTPRKILKLPGQVFRLLAGVREARSIMGRLHPLAVVGFGGYPSFPPLLAAMSRRIDTFIHEQNAVIGRANKVLAYGVTSIASSFPKIAGLPPRAEDKVEFVGNPVRDAVLSASFMSYTAPEANQPFRLLVFGGSQGARVFSEIVPTALKSLPQSVRNLLSVTQQVRPEDMDEVQEAYRRSGIDVELAPFFYDMPERVSRAHLIIGRSGASTIAELAVIGRPAILVPLPHSLDNDQLLNARAFTTAGGGWLLEQSEFTPERLSSLVTKLRYSERELQIAAESAKEFGRPDAASRLADLVEDIAIHRIYASDDSDGPADEEYEH